VLRQSVVAVELLEVRQLLSGLPSGWTDTDIGSPSLAGSAGYTSTSNSFSVSGSGTGIGSTSDQFNFLSYNLTGGGSIVAEVNSLNNTSAAASAGVMIRNDTTASAAFAGIFVTAQDGVEFQWRGTSSAGSTSITVSGSAPIWLELTQSSGSISAYESNNGTSWTQVGSTQTISMTTATDLAGLAVSSATNSALNTANFTSVSLLRPGWTDQDIGGPAPAGSADYDSPSDTTTINAGGSDIYGTADQFNFASTTMTGNGSILAYVNSITDTNAWAKAGVMLRNDTTAGSAYAGVFASAANGIVFEYRASDGATTNQEISSPAGGPVLPPVGLELTRSGNTFTAYYSTNGTSWIQVGPSQTVTMGNTALAGLAVTAHDNGADCTATFSSVGIGSSPAPGAGIYSSSDQLFLNNLEENETMYFWDETNPSTGLVPDNADANGGNPSPDSSIAAIGFGLTALTIGESRGWISYAQAYNRALTTLNFLYNDGANENGFFYHFLNSGTGTRYETSEVSSVDNAELMAGVLEAAQNWSGTAIQTVAMEIFDRVDWPWMQQSNGIFYGAWTPESGFSGGYGDFSEAALLYLIALGSPTYPTTQASWNAWSRSPQESYGGYTYITADDAALFTEQYPQDWFDLQGLTDQEGLNYYQNSINATLAQRAWMTSLSSTYSDYGPNMWGLTPSEGEASGGGTTYETWGGPPADGPINGTVVPAAAGGSLEFTPRLSLDALEYMDSTYGSSVYQKYGLIDSFNPLNDWYSPLDLGIDLGPMLIAAENSRSNFVWNTFMTSSVAQQAISEAFPSTPPALVSASSVKTYPGLGSVGIPLNVTGNEPSIEYRGGGPTQIVLTFGSGIAPGANFSVSVSDYDTGESDGSISSIGIGGDSMTVDLSGGINRDTMALNIQDVQYSNDPIAGDYTLYINLLAGDMTQSGTVNGSDFAEMAEYFGQGDTMQNYQADIDCEGSINGTDFASLAGDFGQGLTGYPSEASVTTLYDPPSSPSAAVEGPALNSSTTASSSTKSTGVHQTNLQSGNGKTGSVAVPGTPPTPTFAASTTQAANSSSAAATMQSSDTVADQILDKSGGANSHHHVGE
jgi:hypothetical protein